MRPILAWLFGLLLLLIPGTSAAEGDRPALHDAPVVVDPTTIHIPAIPPTYIARDIGGWLRLRYVPNATERVRPIIENAESVKAQLVETLGQPVLDDVEVRVARTAEEMATLAPEGLPPPPYAVGVAYSRLHLVLITLQSPDARADAPDVAETFRHELVHIALTDAIAGHHVPRWFNEGLAIWASGEQQYGRMRTLWDATVTRGIIPLADLDRDFPEDGFHVSIAYAQSADFVRFLLRDGDEARFASLIARMRSGVAFERAISDAYGTDLRKLEFQWREEIAKRYTFLPILTGGSFIWVLLFLVLLVGYVKKRRRAKATLARWAVEEAAVDAAIAAARAASGDTDEDDASPGHPALRRSLAEVPKIEHDGGWHTIH